MPRERDCLIGAARQKKHQKNHEVVKKLTRIDRLLKTKLYINSAADKSRTLQIPEEVPSDNSGDDRESVDLLINTSNHNTAQLSYKMLTSCFQTFLH
jgi:hypothetical protein